MKRTGLKRRSMLRRRTPLRSRRKRKDPEGRAKGWRERALSAADGCAKCGYIEGDHRRLEVHHVVPARMLRREKLDPYPDAVALVLCEVCHARHESRLSPIPRELVPLAAESFAAEHGLDHVLDRIYGPPVHSRVNVRGST